MITAQHAIGDTHRISRKVMRVPEHLPLIPEVALHVATAECPRAARAAAEG